LIEHRKPKFFYTYIIVIATLLVMLIALFPQQRGTALANDYILHEPIIVERAREQVAALIGATSEEIIFTRGDSENDNQAIIGVALANQD